MAEDASISSLLDRVARTAPFRRELAKLGTEEQAVFDHTALPGVPFVAALCINSVPETCRTWVVTPHLRAQESVASQLETWGVHNILFVPEKEVALGEEVGDPELTAERLNVLHRIASGQIGRLTVVLTENSLNDEVPSTRGMKNQGMILKAGETRPPDELEKLFTEAGFEGVPQVISRGQWSRRGGILDVFPLQSANPVRLEFFDDEIESIREFDVGYPGLLPEGGARQPRPAGGGIRGNPARLDQAGRPGHHHPLLQGTRARVHPGRPSGRCGGRGGFFPGHP